ncbi:ABC transporter ATP-binding protein [Microaceticoccus formicicus]|uniref:ABC transporter ATP-binding protein n=1 Tax=Microaceticoccus formicicus TaxID=3118105 RepID=UPI003CD0012F|nr:ABC transporter ATP-binding protein [Peptoniphilaceae bacterium AMB_02]
MENILKVRNISTEFKVGKNKVKIVKNVSLDVKKGQILAIVGESGCGKSVTVHSIINLLPANGRVSTGESWFNSTDSNNVNLLNLKPFGRQMRALRGAEIGMIFQDPMQSLNPVYTIGSQIMENILQHKKISKKEAREIGIEMLKKLGIPEPTKRFDDYPHQFSGGMKQRVMIAIAMVNNPDLLIADEPTTALDVTIQAQIMDLMKDMRDKDGKSVILITHNMGLVAEVADQVAVMYMGRVIEYGQVEDVFENPVHPYTKALLKSVPVPGLSKNQKLATIPGETPDPTDYVKGCEFSNRCPKFKPECMLKDIPLFRVNGDHVARCILLEGEKEQVNENE